MRIKQFVACALLLLIAAGAEPAYSAFWQWSKTAATNATADPTINWAEGMSPSSVNDSARAQMAREAEQRDDQSGSLTTGGTSTAYTVTSNQGMCLSPSVTPQTGQSIAMTMHTANGASPTLGVDSCTVFPIQSGGAAIAANTLVANNPYSFKFNGSAWVVSNFYNRTIVVVTTVKKQIFTSSGTYTPSAGMLYATIECVGSGGGGGGVLGSGSGYNGGGGGGGGSYSRTLATAATVGASQTVTIGTVGTGGPAGNNAGGAGGDTSVGSICIGKGGSGGPGANGLSNVPNGGAGGVAGTGDLTLPGEAGGSPFVSNSGGAASVNVGGRAGGGFSGAARTANPGGAATTTGVTGILYGGGGSGGNANSVGANAAGANGALGIVVITEFNSQ